MLLVLLLCLHEILSKNAFLRSPQGFSLKADAKVGTFRATAKYFRGFFRKITKVFCYFYKIRFIVGKKHGFVAKNQVGTIAKHLIHHLAIVTN